MLLIATSLALLVMYAGVKLLIQIQKEILGSPFRFAAWFFLIAGFLVLALTGACCIAMCCKYGSHMMYKNKMMKEDYLEEHHMGYKKMMRYHYGGPDEDCTLNRHCCDGKITKCCSYMDACKVDTTKISRKP
jgi:hypothetical protein